MEISCNMKIPKWLTNTGYSLSARPCTRVDSLEEGGTALHTVKVQPNQRSKAIKQTIKQVQMAEGYVEYFSRKNLKRSKNTSEI